MRVPRDRTRTATPYTRGLGRGTACSPGGTLGTLPGRTPTAGCRGSSSRAAAQSR